ncbi:MAG: hypothetical protein OXG44_14860 [Gammaproteobacteria bacterium]|nr:hypothetical protein [Gammaproteobacteria bacterium]
MGFTFNREITVENLIAALSVVLTLVGSTITLSCSWSKDRQLVQHEQANRVRNAAAATAAKLEHWRDMSSSLFDAIQPALVQASEDLVDGRSARQVLKARDDLFKELHDVRLSLQAAMRDEDIETSYVYLYGYDSSIRQETLTAIREMEDQMFNCLLKVTETQVLAYLSPERPGERYTSASLGNALRGAVAEIQESFEGQLRGTLDPAVSVLINLVLKPDAELIQRDVGDDDRATTGGATTAAREQ